MIQENDTEIQIEKYRNKTNIKQWVKNISALHGISVKHKQEKNKQKIWKKINVTKTGTTKEKNNKKNSGEPKENTKR